MRGKTIDVAWNQPEAKEPQAPGIKQATQMTGRRFGKRARQQAICPHAVVRWKQVPHPRYGNQVPHFISWIAPLDEPHGCVTR